MHQLELNQKALYPDLKHWLEFLTVKKTEDLKPLKSANPALEEACEMLTKMSNSDDERY